MAVQLGRLKLDCSACTDSQKVDRGCKKDSPIPNRWEIDDYQFQRCPKKIITQETAEYLYAYRRFEKGFLPNSGGWLDQPAKFNNAIDIIENELAEIEQEAVEEQTGGLKK